MLFVDNVYLLCKSFQPIYYFAAILLGDFSNICDFALTYLGIETPNGVMYQSQQMLEDNAALPGGIKWLPHPKLSYRIFVNNGSGNGLMYLSQCWHRHMSPHGVTGPQCINQSNKTPKYKDTVVIFPTKITHVFIVISCERHGVSNQRQLDCLFNRLFWLTLH